MANFIEVVETVSPTDFVPQTSRYINSDVLRYSDQKKLTFETYKRSETPTSADDRFILLDKGTEYRPDVVSLTAYGTPDFWWRILEANNIIDIFDFKAGLTVRVPNNVGF